MTYNTVEAFLDKTKITFKDDYLPPKNKTRVLITFIENDEVKCNLFKKSKNIPEIIPTKKEIKIIQNYEKLEKEGLNSFIVADKSYFDNLRKSNV